ncbi:MAG TPA: hypothetical protein VEA60_12610, partial [Allosphingosinicella sp.]|nr:hypothetical protein [Allosphingosinicella sp.]
SVGTAVTQRPARARPISLLRFGISAPPRCMTRRDQKDARVKLRIVQNGVSILMKFSLNI